ncbi:hypothetical protein OAM52_05290 [Flavobacteriaceae bacterium]|nr:hypothetical protein [Flavobacteriaceae bacterium]
MTIKYLDYPNSESIFGISNLEFLSEQEKYKLIPNKLSDIDINGFFTKIKDNFLKQRNELFKLWESDGISEKISEKNSFFKETWGGFKNLKKSKLYNESNDIYFGLGNGEHTICVFTNKGMVISVKSKGSSLIQEDYWNEIEINILSEFLLINNLKGIETISEIENGLSGTGYFPKLFKETLVNELSKICMEILVKSRKESEETKTNVLTKLDKDNNGTIDIIEDKNEFNLLLKKHQKIVIEKGKEFNQNYTHQFIKVGNYIKQKRSNLQLKFDSIKNEKNNWKLSEYVEILEGEIHSYNLLLINSLNLIVSLIEDDQITFYEIYEKFDKLNIYNSNWENEISQKLTSLNKGISELNSNIKGLMYEIRDMGDRIVNSIEDLSYITEESTKMLDNRLGEIDSSIKTNNLLTLIQTYQTYKINKNTKSLKG